MKDLIVRAENETRTRDPNLGKVVLYQLSYFRLLLTTERSFFRLRMQRYAISANPQNFSMKYFTFFTIFLHDELLLY